jgi:N-acetylmuramoyl-L-alanine amidase
MGSAKKTWYAMSTDPNIDTLARTIYGEARGQGGYGMRAVACAIMNRVALAGQHPHFGDGTVSSCCQYPWQFSCWNQNDPNLPILQKVLVTDPNFALAIQIATDAVNGNLPDITDGATYYYAMGTPVPPWAVDKNPCATIGRHVFFKDIA